MTKYSEEEWKLDLFGYLKSIILYISYYLF